jgi:hypothetical protein
MEKTMKLAICIALGIAALGIAYSIGPDMARYMKMRSM